MMVLF